MYILTRNSKFFAVPLKSRTCVIGFREYKKASDIKNHLSNGVNHIKFETQNLQSNFETVDNKCIQVSKVKINNNFHDFIEMNNFMIFMTNEYTVGSDVLSLNGFIMDHEFDKNVSEIYPRLI